MSQLRNAVEWIREQPAKAAAIAWLAPLPIFLVVVAFQPIWTSIGSAIFWGVALALFLGLIVYVGYRLWSRPTRLLLWIVLAFTVGSAVWLGGDRQVWAWWSWVLDFALVVFLIMALRKPVPRHPTP